MAFLRKLILLIAVSLSALFSTSCFKQVETETEIGFKGLAKIDKFLAANRLIESMGIQAASYPQLPHLPSDTDTLLFLPAASLSNEGTLQMVDEWVMAGGNLICLLQVTNEGRHWSLTSEDEEHDESDTPNSPVQEFLHYYGLEVSEEQQDHVHELSPTIDGVTKTYKADFRNHGQYTLIDQGAENPDLEGSLVVRFKHGSGSLTTWTTGAPFTNEQLKKAEHATLLWDLVNHHQPSSVWFVYSSKISFFGLLWEYGAYALITLIILLIVWIWASTKRFGPTFKTIYTRRNTIHEHLESSGAFYQKHQADILILEQLRATLLLKLTRRVNLPINTPASQILTEAQAQNCITQKQGELFTKEYPTSTKDQLVYLQELQILETQL